VNWTLPRVLLPKNRVKLLLNMVLIATQTIPRGGALSIEPVGEGETMGFRVAATGANARIPQAVPPLLSGDPAGHAVDAHAIQPFYTGMLARSCGLAVAMASEGEAVVVSAR
jgi:histidine phosphotransferase ChpT